MCITLFFASLYVGEAVRPGLQLPKTLFFIVFTWAVAFDSIVFATLIYTWILLRQA